jgi:hypothetical protein
MRPPARSQDPLRTPLNELFGAEGNVRVLRVLAARKGGLGRAAVAREAHLNPRGVRAILDRLALAGIVNVQQSGRAGIVALREKHPLTSVIRRLFRQERALYDRVITTVRDAAGRAALDAHAVWVGAGSATGTAEVGVLAPASDVDRAVHALEQQLRKAEQSLAIHFSVRAYTDAEHKLVEERDTPVNVVFGWLPFDWRQSGGGPLRSHRDLDERARRLAAHIGKRIAADPTIIDRAVEWIDLRERSEPGPSNRALAEWRSVLTSLSTRQIEALLVEESERADRLRQSLPFVDVLTPDERAAVFHEVAHDA